jgi:hypothetical protein
MEALVSSGKISSSLSESLREADADDWIDLVVEVGGVKVAEQPGSDRAAKISARKAAFAQSAKPVAEEIRRLGGEVLGQAWINNTIRARVAKKMIPELTETALVSRLDTPRTIQADLK